MQKFPRDILETIRIQLEDEKRRVSARIDELSKQDPFADTDRLIDNAASDREADEASSHDRYTALIEELHARQQDIDDALMRISNGTYGYCTSCGAMIDTDRLAILPTASLCTQCETKRNRS